MHEVKINGSKLKHNKMGDIIYTFPFICWLIIPSSFFLLVSFNKRQEREGGGGGGWAWKIVISTNILKNVSNINFNHNIKPCWRLHLVVTSSVIFIHNVKNHNHTLKPLYKFPKHDSVFVCCWIFYFLFFCLTYWFFLLWILLSPKPR